MSNSEDEDFTPYREQLSSYKRRRMLAFVQDVSYSSSENEGGDMPNVELVPNSPISSGGFVWSSTTSTALTGISNGESVSHRDGSPLPNPDPVLHNLDARLLSPDAAVAHIPDIPDYPDPEPSDHGDDSDDDDTSDDEMDERPINFNDAGDPVPDEPLYPGAPLTQHQSYLSILAFIARHHLNRSCASDLIDLIDLHCPKPKDNYLNLLKHFDELNTPVETKYYCNGCHGECQEENFCETCGVTRSSSLVLYPITAQLQSMFSRNGFHAKLNYKVARQKLNENNIEDIYDGEVYKEQEENGYFDQQSSLSFRIYTDGVKVFKSSRTDIWPVYLTINELPRSERFLKENVIFAGLWCGSGKPVGNILLAPLRGQLTDLYAGVPMYSPDVGRITVKGLVICGTGDTPAREMEMNINIHVGYCSCTRCKARGERIANVQTFPYEPHLELRTVDGMRQDAAMAMNLPPNANPSHVNGVKGPSELSNIMPDFVRGMAIDEMHDVQGVVKKLLALWFDPSFHLYNFNRSGYVGVVDERLLQIEPPNFIKRKPRSIKDNLAHYKMSELKSLGLFYLPVILRGVISVDHHRHFLLFVTAVWYLCQRSISEEDIELARRLLHEYVKRYAELYAPVFLTINVHQLCHLPDVVRDLGPLWVTSCFPDEDLNRQILEMVHGTRFTEKQISKSVRRYLALPSLVSNLPEGPCKLFCEKMSARGHKVKITEVINERVGVVGKITPLVEVPPAVARLLNAAQIRYNTVEAFARLCVKNAVYTTASYDRERKSKSCCIQFHDNVGTIENFLKVSLECWDCQGERCDHNRVDYFGVVNVCQRVESFVTAAPYVEVPYIFRYEVSNEYVLIRPTEIRGMKVLIEQGEQLFMAEPPVMSECNL